MHITVSIVVMQVTLNSYVGDSFKTTSFHKIDQKIFKGIMSGLHLTTFVNNLPKLRYFEGRNYIQIGHKSYSVLFFPDRPMKSGDILDF